MFPQDLKEKYKDWYNDTYLKKKNLFESLAKEGQSPKYIIISCVDSRVDPNSIFKVIRILDSNWGVNKEEPSFPRRVPELSLIHI